MPLFATLLGNDYIEKRMFRKFYSQVKSKKGQRKKASSPQQKRIASIFEWLKNESLKSALHKITAVMKANQRDGLLRQIKAAMQGYSSEKSVAYEYFGFKEKELEEDLELELELIEGVSEDVDEDVVSSESEVEEAEEEENSEEEEEELGEEEQEIEIEDEPEIVEHQKKPLPDWLQAKFQRAELPRFFVDLFAGHRYVNYPQVEDLSMEDGNELSYPILLRIYAILLHPGKFRLWYMTRVQKYARFYYKKFEESELPEVTFNSTKMKNLDEFKTLFEKFNNKEEIFATLKDVPQGLKLYLLAIIYWMRRSKLVTSIHLHTILLGLLVTFIIDRKFSVLHDEAKFVKSYSKLLEELKQKKLEPSEEESFSGVSKALTKHEAILAMERLIPAFNANEKFQRRHADFNRAIVHCFAELQSVCFFLHSYNSLCNDPFESIKMSQLFNGFFVYNTFVSLKSRTDVDAFVYGHLLKNAPNFAKLHRWLFAWCSRLLPKLEKIDEQRIKVKPKKAQSVKAAAVSEAKVKLEKAQVENDCIGAEEHSDQEEFDDVNNLFSQLLKIS